MQIVCLYTANLYFIYRLVLHLHTKQSCIVGTPTLHFKGVYIPVVRLYTSHFYACAQANCKIVHYTQPSLINLYTSQFNHLPCLTVHLYTVNVIPIHLYALYRPFRLLYIVHSPTVHYNSPYLYCYTKEPHMYTYQSENHLNMPIGLSSLHNGI